jgi:hypothetical protein
MNSIQRIGDKYLLNSRHCWSTFLIDSDGNIEWYLDGSDGDNFTLPSPDIFVRPSAVTWRKYCELTLAPKQKWQHHARIQNITELSIQLHYFDNNNAEWKIERQNLLASS